MRRSAFVCLVLAIVFMIATVLFYLDSTSSISYGKETLNIANFQKTVFAVGCGIISAVLLVGGMILSGLEEWKRHWDKR